MMNHDASMSSSSQANQQQQQYAPAPPPPLGQMGNNALVGGYAEVQDVGYVPVPMPSGQETGRYVFQPDGSQVYVPYTHDQ